MKRVYNKWAGNPDGIPEDPERCIAQVPSHPILFHQCQRKRGYGPNSNYCRQHAKMIAYGCRVSVPKAK